MISAQSRQVQFDRFRYRAEVTPASVRLLSAAPLAAALLLAAGCSESADQTSGGDASAAPQTVAAELPGPPAGSVAALRAAFGLAENEGQFERVAGEIVAADLSETDITTLEPLVEVPIRRLGLEKTAIDDFGPLADLPLEYLYAADCAVSDLTPLAGKSIEQLNLMGCPVESLEPLADCRLGTLWLRRCPVSDIGPLVGTGLESLDVQDTRVADLTPAASMTDLRRLNIAGTPVADLSPLRGLRLERIILTPSTIGEGWDALREMPSLQAIDTSFDGEQPQAMAATEFWRRLDAGELND